ncbi:DeoR family transcriptional regulator [Bacillus sp. M6-12]|uniref:DeoR/GlpR family DNA-binding transcription regulator n=1 Tax=Bacillus sp. M6-12 TaxID=2054166 RepID=UPI000C779D09|nr:DeoR/GlpR family DNA-binding transcription regulator [Bacillus sp. M6-12]PLS17103.1 DeoR family transcriptional regulator [Bacillus sp. M6-12]
MLTEERHFLILSLLKEKQTVKLQELVEHLQASESTVRRDLIQLEEQNQLKRVHGGAALLQRKGFEPTVIEKIARQPAEKQKIGKAAASFIEDGDCIYLDAGTTTSCMIPHLEGKRITVITNGLMHIAPLMTAGIKTIIVGGQLKESTNAIVGSMAVRFLSQYRFDKCFLGMNGIHPEIGFTTPDPEEAVMKSIALSLSNECFVLADSSKLQEVTFSKVAEVSSAVIITDENNDSSLEPYINLAKVKVVTA